MAVTPKVARGRFITLEGPEGSGKTTAARHLAAWLSEHGLRVIVTAEPGGTPLGRELRQLLLHRPELSGDLDSRADALLFAAGRAQHSARVIAPALERGDWVVSDRYLDSSVAYQGYGYGLELDELRRLQAFATHGLRPDRTLLLDVPVEVGLTRNRGRRWNRFEDEAGMAFHERVRRGYLELARQDPERFRVVDAAQTVERVDEEIRAAVRPLLSDVETRATSVQ